MNIRKLYLWYNSGIIDKEIFKLNLKQLELLHQGFTEELKRYKEASKNYSIGKTDIYAKPYIERIDDILSKLELQIHNKIVKQ